MDRILKELLPLFIPLIISLLLITYIPAITMWLPGLL